MYLVILHRKHENDKALAQGLICLIDKFSAGYYDGKART